MRAGWRRNEPGHAEQCGVVTRRVGPIEADVDAVGFLQAAQVDVAPAKKELEEQRMEKMG